MLRELLESRVFDERMGHVSTRIVFHRRQNEESVTSEATSQLGRKKPDWFAEGSLRERETAQKKREGNLIEKSSRGAHSRDMTKKTNG